MAHDEDEKNGGLQGQPVPGRPGQPYGTRRFPQQGAQGGPPFAGQQFPTARGGPGGPGYPYGPAGFGPAGPAGPSGPAGPYGPGGPAGPYGPAQYPPPPKNSSGKVLGIIAAVAGVIVLGIAFLTFVVAKVGSDTIEASGHSASSGASNSARPDHSYGEVDYSAGECVSEKVERSHTASEISGHASVVDCADPKATYEIMGVRTSRDSPKCIDTSGATASITYEEEDPIALCLGPIGMDKSKSVNDAKESDCIAETGDHFEITDCGAPGTRMVVAIVQHPARSEGTVESIPECEAAGHPETESLYTWAVPSDYESTDSLEPERGLCLVTP